MKSQQNITAGCGKTNGTHMTAVAVDVDMCRKEEQKGVAL